MNLVNKNDNSTVAIVLIGIGVLALLGTLGIFTFIGSLLGALLFGGLAYFAYVEGRRRGSTTWRLAALPLAGLAIAAIAPWRLGSGAFLASLGLAFAVYWHEDRTRWWALIPAGTLASLGIVSFFEAVFGPSVGWLFLAGMALTFYALTRLDVEPQSWAIWPAAGLALVALLSIVDGAGWIVPVALLAAGAFMLLRSGTGRDALSGMTSRHAPPSQPETASATEASATQQHPPAAPPVQPQGAPDPTPQPPAPRNDDARDDTATPPTQPGSHPEQN